MRKSDFIKFINSLEEEELKDEFNKLFDKLPQVKEYYTMELGSDQDRARIFDNAKKSISRYYATKSFRKPKAPRIRYIQNLLRDMKERSIFDHEMVDLYLFDVETALEFMGIYYFSSKSLNNNLERSFTNACHMIKNGNLQALFIGRVEAIMKKASKFNEIYWTFNTNFLETFR